MILNGLNVGELLGTLAKVLKAIGVIEPQGQISGTDSHAQLDVKMGKTLTTMVLEKSSSAVRFYLEHNKSFKITCNFANNFYSPYEVFIFFFNRILVVYDNDGFKDDTNTDYATPVEAMTLQKYLTKARIEAGASSIQEFVTVCGSNTYEQFLVNMHISYIIPAMQSQYGMCSELVFAFTGYLPFMVYKLTYSGVVCGYRINTKIQGIDCYYDVNVDVAEKNGISNIVIAGEEVLGKHNGLLITEREASGSIKCKDISDSPEMVKYLLCYCLPNRDLK